MKTPCVALNQAILSFQGRTAPPELVIHCAEALLRTLRKLEREGLNARLAEYAFVPLSFIFRASAQLPVRASELAFECLSWLIELGWKQQVAGQLGNQLLILFAITADRSNPNQQARPPTEELLRAVFSCLSKLFRYLGETAPGRAQLEDAANAPHLGHAVTVVLHGITTDDAADARLAAARAINELLSAISDHELLANFLPGVVSSLTKVLTPSTKSRAPWKLLSRSLDVLTTLLTKTVGDIATSHLKPKTDAASPAGHGKLDKAWLEATAGQLKLALANVNRLHSHDRFDVRRSLFKLNLAIVRDCAMSLENCQQLCLETILVLLEDERFSENKASVARLLHSTPKLSNSLTETLRDWTLSLPRILEGSDEDKKSRRLRQMFTAYDILQNSLVTGETSLHQLLSESLPEWLAIILRTRGKDKSTFSEVPAVRLDNLPLALRTDRNVSFADALSTSRFQTETLYFLQSQLQYLSAPDIASSLAAQVRTSTGDLQVAAMWLSLNLISSKDTSSVDALMNLGDDEQLWKQETLDDLYEFSLTTIENEHDDWRLKALGLEAVAAQAQSLGQDFRNELIDVLYPVLHLLGGESPRLRQHAMVCLNAITQACGFADAKELVVANADYLVNAISLRLNSFDVSPQGPQVLLMMVNLAGPNLVPYLEDTVESIFAVLEDYHGYTTLVELLFSVLNAIGEQGAQEARLQIEAAPGSDSYPSLEWQPVQINTLADFLRDRRKTRSDGDIEIVDRSDATPKEPWKSVAAVREDPDPDQMQTDERPDTVSMPAGKTYPLLLRIAQQTQHHLPSASPSLRLLLLNQLQTLLPALAKHEDSFLPLINTLWPELVARLMDEETSVLCAAMVTITAVAKLAGQFLRSRIRDLWPEIKKLHRRVADAESGRSSSRRNAGKSSTAIVAGPKGGYVDTSAAGLRVAFVGFIVTATTSVGLDDGMFDEALRMLGPWDGIAVADREALQRIDPGAVWVARWRQTQSTPP